MENNIEYNNTSDFFLIRKTIVNYIIVIFGLIFIMIFILLGLYYLSPNNYSLLEWSDNKFNLIKTVEYVIKPNSNLLINDKITNVYLKFSEKINLIIKNYFKSQMVEIDTEQLITEHNSEIYIINNSNIEKKIIVQFYLKI